MTETVQDPIAAPAQIDGEHKVQLELLTALSAAARGESGCVTLDEILEQYVSYTDLHFMSEQLLMRLYAHPEYDEHMRDHEILSERMKTMRTAHVAGDLAALVVAVAEHKSHLVGHLGSHDRAFDRFLRETA